VIPYVLPWPICRCSYTWAYDCLRGQASEVRISVPGCPRHDDSGDRLVREVEEFLSAAAAGEGGGS
jgi:hypothetical protein